MSLSDDFGMYYNGTYVGLRNDEDVVVPFYIEAITFDSNVLNLRSIPSSEREKVSYSEEALNALVFHGSTMRENHAIPYNDPRLVLELPDSKFIKVRNTFFWVSYRSYKTTKKGVTSRRMVGIPVVDFTYLTEFFKETSYPEVFGGIFLKTDDDLRYKDVYVGKFTGENTVELFPEASHLLRVVSREIPNCQVTVQTALQA